MIVLTTWATAEDTFRPYDLGASSFITRPVMFADFIRTKVTVTDYWL